jgi:hypothetical protein
MNRSYSTPRSKGAQLIGSQFGKLTITEFLGSRIYGGRKTGFVKCFCRCGRQVEVPIPDLKTRQSCSISCAKTKHGLTNSRTWRSWQSMLKRCHNPEDEHFKHYGARGITVCPEWHDFNTFLADMGIRPTGRSLGRLNNDLGYSKVNCEWQTQLQQSRNKRSTRWVTWQGLTLPLAEWGDRLGIRLSTLSSRQARNYPPERLFRPVLV